MNLKKEMQEIKKKNKDLDKMMTVGLMTLGINTSSARTAMFFSHLTQFNQLENSERPLVTTGYENAFAHYSKIQSFILYFI